MLRNGTSSSVFCSSFQSSQCSVFSTYRLRRQESPAPGGKPRMWVCSYSKDFVGPSCASVLSPPQCVALKRWGRLNVGTCQRSTFILLAELTSSLPAAEAILSYEYSRTKIIDLVTAHFEEKTFLSQSIFFFFLVFFFSWIMVMWCQTGIFWQFEIFPGPLLLSLLSVEII